MSVHVVAKPSFEVIHQEKQIYVRETVRFFDVGGDGQEIQREQLPPLDHGPFDGEEEASRFIRQRAAWAIDLMHHLQAVVEGKADRSSAPKFVFDGREGHDEEVK